MSSIGKLMKQAGRIQRQMEQAQADLAERTVETTSGGGAVKVTAKCDGRLKAISINPESIDKEDTRSQVGIFQVEDSTLMSRPLNVSSAFWISGSSKKAFGSGGTVASALALDGSEGVPV